MNNDLVYFGEPPSLLSSKQLSFDDVLIKPEFSFIESRKDVSIKSTFLGLELETPIISSNMDTITASRMAREMAVNGALGALHRFMDVPANVGEFLSSTKDLKRNHVIVSVGVGTKEVNRAVCLKEVGATHFLIDVAHGAAIHVVKQYDELRTKLGDDVYIIVGNFADNEGIQTFNKYVKSNKKPDAFKVGIGGGSLCTTRIVTGCGAPTLASVSDCSRSGYPIIADGGIRNSGDIAKALAAGASVVMLGQLLAGTDETPGEINIEYTSSNPTHVFYNDGTLGYYPINNFDNNKDATFVKVTTKYRGSASLESYEVQGKVAEHRAPEGESTLVPYKGPVKDVLTTLSSGLRSSLAYVNATNLTSFRKNAKMIEVSSNTVLESRAHAKEK